MHPHFSLAEILLWNLGPDAEAAMPGHGRELIALIVTTADAAMIVGFVGGLGAAYYLRRFWLGFLRTEVYAAFERFRYRCFASVVACLLRIRDAD